MPHFTYDYIHHYRFLVPLLLPCPLFIRIYIVYVLFCFVSFHFLPSLYGKVTGNEVVDDAMVIFEEELELSTDAFSKENLVGKAWSRQ